MEYMRTGGSILDIQELYDVYEAHLLRFARSLTRDTDDAEDLVQETFLKAISNMVLLQTLAEHKIKSWLFRVLKNIFIDKYRRQRVEIPVEDEEIVSDFSVEDEVEGRMLSEEFLKGLPDKDREIVYKRYWLGMTSREIAKLLSIPDSTVRYRLHISINHIKSEYNKLQEGIKWAE
jgi:RNA polymerase sigma-70 factor (ECF subfamily)